MADENKEEARLMRAMGGSKSNLLGNNKGKKDGELPAWKKRQLELEEERKNELAKLSEEERARAEADRAEYERKMAAIRAGTAEEAQDEPEPTPLKQSAGVDESRLPISAFGNDSEEMMKREEARLERLMSPRKK